jgi:beta-galactosidase
VALLFDYDAKWLLEIHFQGIDFEYQHFVFDYYSTLRSLGLDVDIVPLNADLQGYAMIVVPPLPIVPDDLPGRIARQRRTGGVRPAQRVQDQVAADSLDPAPGPLQQLLPMRVWRVESMRPNVSETVRFGTEEGQRPPLARPHRSDGPACRPSPASPMAIRPSCARSAHYLASIFDEG